MTDPMWDQLKEMWDNLDIVGGRPRIRYWSRCDDCSVMLTDGDLCGHCERKHVRRAVERHGIPESAGVCGPCATEAGLLAARTGGDAAHLYDDTLRRKAGLPVTCEPDKADQLDVELCDKPVKLAAPEPWWALGDAYPIKESDLELTDMEPLTSAIQRDIAASMVRHPAGSMLNDQSKWAVRRMPAGPPLIGPEDSLSDLGMIVHRHVPGDGELTPLDDDVEAELVAIRRTQAWVTDLLAQPHGPAVQVVVDALSKRLDQLEAAALAKRGNQ